MSSFSLDNVFATLPYTERGMPIVLGGDPKGKNFLYTNGNSVIIRDIANPSIADVYTQHSSRVRVAKYSPSGYYICSGDNLGKVRIWDTTQKEHLLKNEFQPMGGAIKDLAWDIESKRIVVVGEGREKFGHVFAADAGNSLGEIMGHSKAINSCDFRPARPFNIVTAAEDNAIAFFEGRPFKFKCSNTEHTRFVNAIRYLTNGDSFISGGADGKAFIFDGKTGEKKGELGSPAHKGGIYAVCSSPDSKQVLTVSGDKTAKIWDVETTSIVSEFTMGNTVQDMQVGCLWQDNYLLSVSLSGYINYLDVNNPSKPLRIIKGHNKPITAMAVSREDQDIYTGASDGQMYCWNRSTGQSEMVTGSKVHANQIQDIVVNEDQIVSCGMDDTVIFTSLKDKEIKSSVKMPSQPKGIAASHGGLVVVACINDIVLLRGDQQVFIQRVKYEAQCASIHPGQTQVAIGGGTPDDQKVHIYQLNNDTLEEIKTLEHGGAVIDVCYSPDGAYLAACDSYRKVLLYNIPDYENQVGSEWAMHTAKVNSIDWTPDSRNIVTCSLDTSVIVWYPEKSKQRCIIRGAHPLSQVTRVKWLDNNTIVSCGNDCSVRIWSIAHA